MRTSEKVRYTEPTCGRVFLIDEIEKNLRFKKFSDLCGPSGLVFYLKLTK